MRPDACPPASEEPNHRVSREPCADHERWPERQRLLVCRHPGLRVGNRVGRARPEDDVESDGHPDEPGRYQHVDSDQADVFGASQRGGGDRGRDDERDADSLRTTDAEYDARAERGDRLEPGDRVIMAFVRGPAGRCARGARARDRTCPAVASSASPSASSNKDLTVS